MVIFNLIMFFFQVGRECKPKQQQQPFPSPVHHLWGQVRRGRQRPSPGGQRRSGLPSSSGQRWPGLPSSSCQRWPGLPGLHPQETRVLQPSGGRRRRPVWGQEWRGDPTCGRDEADSPGNLPLKKGRFFILDALRQSLYLSFFLILID